MGRTQLSPGTIPVANNPSDPLSTQTTFDTVIQDVDSGTAKNADENWFVVPTKSFQTIASERGAICRIDFMFSGNDARISFTYDNVNYAFLFEGVVLKADSLYSIRTGVENGSQFNMRADQDIVIERCVTVVEGKQATS